METCNDANAATPLSAPLPYGRVEETLRVSSSACCSAVTPVSGNWVNSSGEVKAGPSEGMRK
jgi:hypothetical protein